MCNEIPLPKLIEVDFYLLFVMKHSLVDILSKTSCECNVKLFNNIEIRANLLNEYSSLDFLNRETGDQNLFTREIDRGSNLKHSVQCTLN